MSRRVIGIISLLIFLFAIFAVRQWYKTQKHNQILAQQISDAVEYKEKYKQMKRAVEKPLVRPSDVDAPQTDNPQTATDPGQPATDNSQKATDNSKLSADDVQPTADNAQLSTDNLQDSTDNPQLSTDNSQLSTDDLQMTADDLQLQAQSEADLFVYLRDLIEREQLFLDPNFERQTLIDITGISKNRIGAAFAQGSGQERLTSIVREMRLDYAVRLMNEQPGLSIEQVRMASGFTSADTFSRNFKAKYGMTPTAYRANRR